MENDCPKQYFIGACQGGRSIKFLLACELLYQNVLQDQQNGITAVWHDESHWNRFLHHRSDVKCLSENFCSREEDNRAEEDISIFLPSKSLQIGYAYWRAGTNTSKKQPRIIMKVRRGLGNQIWQYIGALALYGEHIDNKKKKSQSIYLDISWYKKLNVADIFLLDKIFPNVHLLHKEVKIDAVSTCNYKSDEFDFNEVFSALPQNTLMEGDFQHKRYFEIAKPHLAPEIAALLPQYIDIQKEYQLVALHAHSENIEQDYASDRGVCHYITILLHYINC